MSARFAEVYLGVRSKLAGLLQQIEQLAEKSHTKVEGLQEMAHQLEDPLKLLLCGDSGVGRSTFIDILMGTKVSSKLKSGNWSAIDFSNQKDLEKLPFAVKKVQHEDLADLLLIESKPCNQLTTEDDEQMAYWAKQADVIFWVFSVDNPWSATTWGKIDQLPVELIERSVIVLNRVDEIAESDIKVTLGHMASLAEQRLPVSVPIFPVAGKKEIKGFAEVWERTNNLIEYSPSRLDFLEKVYEKAQRVIEYLEDVMDKRAQALDGDRGFLRSLEADIDRQREREIQLYAGRGVNLSGTFVDQIEPMLENLHAKCGVARSTIDLFGRGMVASAVEKDLIQASCEVYGKRVNTDCEKILAHSKEQWHSMQGHLNERLGADAGGFQVEPFQKLMPQIQEKVEKSVKMAVLSMKLKTTMDALLEPRRESNKRILAIVLSIYTLAGICGTLKLPPSSIPAYVLLAIAILGSFYYLACVLISRHNLVKGVADRVVDMRIDFRDSIIEDYQYMIREFFTGYAPMFEEMRRKIAEAKMNLEPMQKEHHALFLQLKVLENEITNR